jgi:hypothetical protein
MPLQWPKRLAVAGKGMPISSVPLIIFECVADADDDPQLLPWELP